MFASRMMSPSSGRSRVRVGARLPCRNGLACYVFQCAYSHAPGWKGGCFLGLACSDPSCGKNHPPRIVPMNSDPPAPSPNEGASGKRLHPGVYCDACGDMSEVRYKCLDCANFDLCSSCEASFPIFQSHFEGKHNFAKLRDSTSSNVERYVLTKPSS